MQNQFGEAELTAYCHELRAQERSAATVEKYTHALRAFWAWLPDEKAVDKETAINYKAQLAANYAPASVNVTLAALNSFFRFMGWQDCCLKPLHIQRRVFTSKENELTRAEYERLVAAAERRQNTRLSLLLQLMASTGIRVSEVHAVTVEAAQAGKAVISLKGKIRTILMPGKLCRKLLQYAKAEKIASGELFLTRSGRPLNRKEIWAQFKHLCRAAGVASEKVFPHNLRHLFARVFYAAQKDIAKLADILGHSSVETTRIYLITTGEEHMQALDRLRLVC